MRTTRDPALWAPVIETLALRMSPGRHRTCATMAAARLYAMAGRREDARRLIDIDSRTMDPTPSGMEIWYQAGRVAAHGILGDPERSVTAIDAARAAGVPAYALTWAGCKIAAAGHNELAADVLQVVRETAQAHPGAVLHHNELLSQDPLMEVAKLAAAIGDVPTALEAMRRVFVSTQGDTLLTIEGDLLQELVDLGAAGDLVDLALSWKHLEYASLASNLMTVLHDHPDEALRLAGTNVDDIDDVMDAVRIPDAAARALSRLHAMTGTMPDQVVCDLITRWLPRWTDGQTGTRLDDSRVHRATFQ